MRVISVADVEAASVSGSARLLVAQDDLVTPLARDRAAELGVSIEAGPAPAPPPPPSAGRLASALGSRVNGSSGSNGANDSRQRDPSDAPGGRVAPPAPPVGILYRRGAPVVTDRVRVESVIAPARTGAGRGRTNRAIVVGAGHVGANTALHLLAADLFDEVVMVDVVPGLAAGLALDLWHSAKLTGFATRVRGASDLAEAGPVDFVVITAGRPRQPGMSRTDLTAANAAIVGAVCEGVRANCPDAIVVVVTNPLDEMTELAWRITGFPPERVMGMAGVLDASRFCSLAALALGERPESVEALALGSHGDEMVVPLSQALVRGEPITRRLDAATLEALVDRTRNSGAEVVKLLEKGSAYYAPGASAARMVAAMARDSGEILPACVRAQGAYGIRDIYLGLPARLGRAGVLEIVEVPLTPSERSELEAAAMQIAKRVGELAPA